MPSPIRRDVARDDREIGRERVGGFDRGFHGAHVLATEMNIAQMDELYGHAHSNLCRRGLVKPLTDIVALSQAPESGPHEN